MCSDSTIADFLATIIKQTNDALAKGNIVGAKYLANICGMWHHTAHFMNNSPFANDNLSSAFYNGFAASQQATDMNEELNKKFQNWDKIRKQKIAQEKLTIKKK